MLKKFLEHINYLSDELDYPNTILEVVCLPSGVFFEISLKEYNEISELYDTIINWSVKYNCYVCRDKDFSKIQKVIGRNLGDDQDSFVAFTADKLEKFGIKKYKITNKGVEVFESVSIKNYKCKILPVKFDSIHGNFEVSRCGIERLDNFPTKVSGNFICTYNIITDLVGEPKEVGDSYICSRNKLKNLFGSPIEIPGNFDCSYNDLDSLSYSPGYVEGNFDCSYNMIKSLKSSPVAVDGIFDCSFNQLVNLDGIPKDCYKVISNNNKF